ncbi:type II toxin-antitoxin system PemK/MazF family toxin [Cytobacillus praedii]|uniref:type II toxin-antitoxin system PemK/MazF family toxin n=1 Tax=Cytobacillus praedii TaxID=1742358 RepID=UPI003F7F7439
MTSSTGTVFNQGDVWLAIINFSENRNDWKRRPVVIVGNEKACDLDMIINPITTQQPRNEFDVVLQDWQEAGLARPSVVRTSKPDTFHKQELERKLGSLSEKDLANVLEKCKQVF